MTNQTFDFKAFINDSKESVMNPKSFFSTMSTTGGIGNPLIKALIYGVITGLITLIWSFFKIGAVTGGFLGGAIGVAAFIWTVAFSIIALFIGAIIILLLSAICSGRTDFEPAIRVSAALMVLMPVNAFFAFVGSISTALGTLVFTIISLYGLWMLYNALVQTLKAKENSVKILSWVLVAIFILFLLIGMTVRRKAKSIMDRYDMESIEDIGRELKEEVDKNLKEYDVAEKELEEEKDKDLEEDDAVEKQLERIYREMQENLGTYGI